MFADPPAAAPVRFHSPSSSSSPVPRIFINTGNTPQLRARQVRSASSAHSLTPSVTSATKLTVSPSLSSALNQDQTSYFLCRSLSPSYAADRSSYFSTASTSTSVSTSTSTSASTTVSPSLSASRPISRASTASTRGERPKSWASPSITSIKLKFADSASNISAVDSDMSFLARKLAHASVSSLHSSSSTVPGTSAEGAAKTADTCAPTRSTTSSVPAPKAIPTPSRSSDTSASPSPGASMFKRLFSTRRPGSSKGSKASAKASKRESKFIANTADPRWAPVSNIAPSTRSAAGASASRGRRRSRSVGGVSVRSSASEESAISEIRRPSGLGRRASSVDGKMRSPVSEGGDEGLEGPETKNFHTVGHGKDARKAMGFGTAANGGSRTWRSQPELPGAQASSASMLSSKPASPLPSSGASSAAPSPTHSRAPSASAYATPSISVTAPSSSSAPRSLPPELLVAIFSHLPRTSLPIVARSARALSGPAKDALYASLDLSPSALPRARAAQLVAALAGTPALARRVRRMTCTSWPVPPPSSSPSSPSPSSASDGKNPEPAPRPSGEGDARAGSRLGTIWWSTLPLALRNMRALQHLVLPSWRAGMLPRTIGRDAVGFKLKSLSFTCATLDGGGGGGGGEFGEMVEWLRGQDELRSLMFPDLLAVSVSSSLSTASSTASMSSALPAILRAPLLPSLHTLSGPPSLVIALAPQLHNPPKVVTLVVRETLYDGLRPTAVVRALKGVKELKIVFGQSVDRRTAEKVLGAVGGTLCAPRRDSAEQEEDEADDGEKLEKLEVHVLWEDETAPETLYKIMDNVLPRYAHLVRLRLHTPKRAALPTPSPTGSPFVSRSVSAPSPAPPPSPTPASPPPPASPIAASSSPTPPITVIRSSPYATPAVPAAFAGPPDSEVPEDAEVAPAKKSKSKSEWERKARSRLSLPNGASLASLMPGGSSPLSFGAKSSGSGGGGGGGGGGGFTLGLGRSKSRSSLMPPVSPVSPASTSARSAHSRSGSARSGSASPLPSPGLSASSLVSRGPSPAPSQGQGHGRSQSRSRSRMSVLPPMSPGVPDAARNGSVTPNADARSSFSVSYVDPDSKEGKALMSTYAGQGVEKVHARAWSKACKGLRDIEFTFGQEVDVDEEDGDDIVFGVWFRRRP